MAPSSRPDSHLNLSYLPTGQPRSGTSTGSSSPSELQAPGSMKSAFGGSNGLVSAGGSIGSARRTAGSPSHELSARIYSKRRASQRRQRPVVHNFQNL
uniref:Uncharacterized protein n=1 Tax=Coccidioides posadasii RMSCC 3488 TaxID=454284 RepID=A0A0J6F6H4_COCPO|nr:hypothetical protein CPAG_02116 [Coccidioides posadasii RMSCC 3488]